jgi:TonB family protein
MRKENKEKHFLNKPIYPGGLEAMKTFIAENIKYPPEAIANKISGLVQIELTIDHKGNVIDTRIIHGLSHECDEEARRVAKLMKFQVSKNRGMKVRFFRKINIHFGKPVTTLVQSGTVPKTQSNPQITYVQNHSHSSGSMVTYNYTINIQ